MSEEHLRQILLQNLQQRLRDGGTPGQVSRYMRRNSGSPILIWFSSRLQLEDVLNRTHPFSIWINGEKIDTLEQEGQRQKKEFSQLEEKYAEMADGVDSIFSDSMKVQTSLV